MKVSPSNIKIFYWLLALISCACSEEFNSHLPSAWTLSTNNNYIGVDSGDREINFDASGGEYSVEVMAYSTWTITGLPSWLSTEIAINEWGSILYGSDVLYYLTLTAQENTSATARSATITLESTASGPKYTQTISVTQEGKEETPVVNNDPLVNSIIAGDWTWCMTTKYNIVWGNAGYQAGPQDDSGEINGVWWGCSPEDVDPDNSFSSELYHSAVGSITGEEYSTAYMEFNENGSLTKYDKDGKLLNTGSFTVEGYNNGEALTDWGTVAYLNTSPGAILWPYAINMDGFQPEKFEIEYLSVNRMILIYAPEDSGSWSECTWWSFGKVGTVPEVVDSLYSPGSGTLDDPYSVAKVIELNNPGTEAWVWGYIVGTMNNTNGIYIQYTEFSANNAVTTNLVLGPTADCTDYTLCVAVQLPSGDVRSALNLKDNPENLGAKVELYGSLEKYCQGNGVKSVSDYIILEGGNGNGNTNNSTASNNSIDNPYTVSEALAIIYAGTYTSDKVYVAGTISQISEVSTTYGNAIYYISDDGSTSNQLEVYRGYYLDGEKFTSEDQIKVGDKVVVYGQIVMYNTIAEITTGSSIVSIN